MSDKTIMAFDLATGPDKSFALRAHKVGDKVYFTDFAEIEQRVLAGYTGPREAIFVDDPHVSSPASADKARKWTDAKLDEIRDMLERNAVHFSKPAGWATDAVNAEYERLKKERLARGYGTSEKRFNRMDSIDVVATEVKDQLLLTP